MSPTFDSASIPPPFVAFSYLRVFSLTSGTFLFFLNLWHDVVIFLEGPDLDIFYSFLFLLIKFGFLSEKLTSWILPIMFPPDIPLHSPLLLLQWWTSCLALNLTNPPELPTGVGFHTGLSTYIPSTSLMFHLLVVSWYSRVPVLLGVWCVQLPCELFPLLFSPLQETELVSK